MRPFLAILCPTTLTFISATFVGDPPAADGATVEIHVVNNDFVDDSRATFDPTINLGDTIRWLFDEGFHSATSVTGLTESWDSGVHFGGPGLPSFAFDHTFTNVGSFTYYCLYHGFDNGDGTAAGMTGIVHVAGETPPQIGDFNGDQVVNAIDLSQWRGDFAQGGGSDADEDDDSDGNDFLLWQANLGAQSSAVSAVPEPSMAALGASLAIVLFATSQQRSRGLRPTWERRSSAGPIVACIDK